MNNKLEITWHEAVVDYLSTIPTFDCRTEKDQNCLQGEVLNSEPPDYKANMLTTRKQLARYENANLLAENFRNERFVKGDSVYKSNEYLLKSFMRKIFNKLHH
jgi:hypothetical protein